MASELSLATQTMFAELLQRSLDAEFDHLHGERGYFIKRKRGKLEKRMSWYLHIREGNPHRETYIGPVADKSITDRINRFNEIKSGFAHRRETNRALEAAGLPRPDSIAGSVMEAMWKAGFFRLRGVLVGSLAYQCYAGLSGVRLTAASARPDDADFAQFWGISENFGQSMAHPLEVSRGVDPTFVEVPNINDPFVTSRYRSSKTGYKVEFLTPNRGSSEHQGQPATMKALAGSGAQPLRHIDFLIHQPEGRCFSTAAVCLLSSLAPSGMQFTSRSLPPSARTRSRQERIFCRPVR